MFEARTIITLTAFLFGALSFVFGAIVGYAHAWRQIRYNRRSQDYGRNLPPRRR